MHGELNWEEFTSFMCAEVDGKGQSCLSTKKYWEFLKGTTISTTEKTTEELNDLKTLTLGGGMMTFSCCK